MTEADRQDKVSIATLSTGVAGFDEVLGGGIPEYSFNLIAGAPGTGKTTLAQQILFTLGTEARPAFHFTVLGEPTRQAVEAEQHLHHVHVQSHAQIRRGAS